MRKQTFFLTALILLIAGITLVNGLKRQEVRSRAAGGLTGLHVQGNRIVTASGQPIQLRGVSISGTEFLCVQSGSIFNGPGDQGLAAMQSWKVNVVRFRLTKI